MYIITSLTPWKKEPLSSSTNHDSVCSGLACRAVEAYLSNEWKRFHSRLNFLKDHYCDPLGIESTWSEASTYGRLDAIASGFYLYGHKSSAVYFNKKLSLDYSSAQFQLLWQHAYSMLDPVQKGSTAFKLSSSSYSVAVLPNENGTWAIVDALDKKIVGLVSQEELPNMLRERFHAKNGGDQCVVELEIISSNLSCLFDWVNMANLMIENEPQVDDRLWAALIHKNVTMVNQALQDGANIVATQNGLNFLQWAIMTKQQDLALFFIENFVAAFNPEERDIFFYEAVKYGLEDAALKLMQDNFTLSNTEQLNKDGVTDLQWALINKQEKVVSRLLMARPFSIHSACRRGRTALHYAVEAGLFSMVKLLMNRDADVNAQDEQGVTPLQLALLAGTDHKRIYDLLIQRGASPNVPNKEGNTILYLAFKHKRFDIVESLLETKIPHMMINHPNKDGETPLHLAIEMKCLIWSELLANQGAYFDIQRKRDGKTPLHLAIELNMTKIASFAIQNGTYLDTQDKEGKTALHKAIEQKNDAIINLLMESGADIHLADNKGQTPLDYVIAAKYTSVLPSLLNKMPASSYYRSYTSSETELLVYLSKQGHVDLLQNFIAYKGLLPSGGTIRRLTASLKHTLSVQPFNRVDDVVACYLLAGADWQHDNHAEKIISMALCSPKLLYVFQGRLARDFTFKRGEDIRVHLIHWLEKHRTLRSGIGLEHCPLREAALKLEDANQKVEDVVKELIEAFNGTPFRSNSRRLLVILAAAYWVGIDVDLKFWNNSYVLEVKNVEPNERATIFSAVFEDMITKNEPFEQPTPSAPPLHLGRVGHQSIFKSQVEVMPLTTRQSFDHPGVSAPPGPSEAENVDDKITTNTP